MTFSFSACKLNVGPTDSKHMKVALQRLICNARHGVWDCFLTTLSTEAREWSDFTRTVNFVTQRGPCLERRILWPRNPSSLDDFNGRVLHSQARDLHDHATMRPRFNAANAQKFLQAGQTVSLNMAHIQNNFRFWTGKM